MRAARQIDGSLRDTLAIVLPEGHRIGGHDDDVVCFDIRPCVPEDDATQRARGAGERGDSGVMQIPEPMVAMR